MKKKNDDEESIGEKILPKKTQLVGIEPSSLYDKPWLQKNQEKKVPKWVKDLEDKPILHIL